MKMKIKKKYFIKMLKNHNFPYAYSINCAEFINVNDVPHNPANAISLHSGQFFSSSLNIIIR